MRKLAMKVAGVALVAGLIAGCGTSGGSGSAAGNADVATGGSKFTTADQETAKLARTLPPGVFPRTLKHANGETTLEKKPTRVVVLDTGELDDVVTLGITPVGMATTEGANPVPHLPGRQGQGCGFRGNHSGPQP